MIDSTQASAPRPRAGEARGLLGPGRAGWAKSEDALQDDTDDDDERSAKPTAFSSTARNGGVNNCASALTAASIIGER